MALCCVIASQPINAEKFKRPNTYNYQRGMEALNNYDLEEALDYFNREIKDNPKNGYAYTWIALIQAQDEEFGLALNACESAIKYLPKKDKEFMSSAYGTRTNIYLALEDTTKALADIEQAMQITPEDVDLYEKRGQIYYEQNKLDLSDNDYRKIIELEPGNTTGYMGLGRNANEQKRWDEAIKHFDYVLKLSSTYSQGYSFRAESYAGLEKWNECTDDIISALQYDYDRKTFDVVMSLKEPAVSILAAKFQVQAAKSPNEPLWPFATASLYENNNEYDKAIKFYSQANDRDAEDTFEYCISRCHFSKGEYSQALTRINNALNMDSTDLTYMDHKASILYGLGDLMGANEMLDKMLENDPEHAASYGERAWNKAILGDFDGAIEDYTMATVLVPTISHAYQIRGDLYSKQGKTDLAVTDYNKVIELEKTPKDFSCNMFAYQALGQYEKAIASMETILANDSTEYYNAACLYARMNDEAKALEYLRKHLEDGNRNFFHITHDLDFEIIRNSDGFKALINEYMDSPKEDVIISLDELLETTNNQISNNNGATVTEVGYTKEGGVCKVKCQINGLPLHFVFDTGAADVTISMVEATFMLKNGYLSDNDIVGTDHYVDANGNISVGTVLNLKNVEFGGFNLSNVRASVVRNQKAPLLLGQSVLGRLGKIEIDNNKKVLRITHNK